MILIAGIILLPAVAARSQDSSAAEWIALFDGETLAGWKVGEHPDTWQVEDGAIVTRGKRSHLFYAGPHQPFRNFILRVDVYTEPHANGGIYFLTKYQATGWPQQGFEAQINNTYIDWKKTGSLYGIKNVLFFSPARDRQWWTQEIRVEGRHIVIRVDGKVTVDYTLKPGVRPAEGTIALQAHGPHSVVKYKNIRIKPLPDSP